MSVDIKQLLKTAIDAKIGGDQKGFNEAMKQVMSAKVGHLLSENMNQPDADYTIELPEFDYRGELYDAVIGVTVGHYSPATQGNFSPTASDPSTYHGDSEELDWDVTSATLKREDGSELVLTPDEVRLLNFTEDQSAQITQAVKSGIGSARDDEMEDRGN